MQSLIIWLPRSYTVDCIAQIWIKETYNYPYIAQVTKVSTSKTQVTIDKIKAGIKEKSVEKKFEDIESCKVFLLVRTVAANGEFSTLSAIYKLQVKSTKIRNQKPQKRILNLLQKYY